MELAFAPRLCPPTRKRANFFAASPNGARIPPFRCHATVATHATREKENGFELENRKHHLLRAIQDTQRGLVTTAQQRSTIEEALVSVEGYDAGEPVDLSKLEGTWRLQYTSAPDVLILLEADSKLPFFQVGQIFQKFECHGKTDGGFVRNVVQWSIPNLLENVDLVTWRDTTRCGCQPKYARAVFLDQQGATLLVSAKFSVISLRNIYLQFEEIAVQNLNISEQLQALVAPAILPRSFLSLQILQSIRAFKAQVPVASPRRQMVGGLYYISYLDGNMLLGRTVGGGGIFVFTRAQSFVQ